MGDEIVDAIEDVIGVTIKTHFEEDPKAKAAKVAELNKSHVLPTLASIEKRLVSRGGQFLVGNNVSLADIHLYFFCSEYTTPPMLNATPKIADLVRLSEVCPISSAGFVLVQRPSSNLPRSNAPGSSFVRLPE